MMIGDTELIWVEKGQTGLKRREPITNICALTKSLMTNSNQLIFHFKDRPDEELLTPKRDEIVFVLKHKYHQIVKENLPIYGVSSMNLKPFITSERD